MVLLASLRPTTLRPTAASSHTLRSAAGASTQLAFNDVSLSCWVTPWPPARPRTRHLRNSQSNTQRRRRLFHAASTTSLGAHRRLCVPRASATASGGSGSGVDSGASGGSGAQYSTTIGLRSEEASAAADRSKMAAAAASGDDAAARVERLRAELRARGLTAYLVPSEDAHMSEYQAACDMRRHYLTGFTGSAGVALVTLDGAYCWTDGRYFNQASKELDPAVFTMMRMAEDPPLEEWVASNLAAGSVIGVDSATVSIATMKRLQSAVCEPLTIKALPPGDNLVDAVWGSARPPAPHSTVFEHDVQFAGEGVREKVGRVRQAMKERGVALHVVAALDEVAWLFNLRGSDVEYNPVFWSYATVTDECATLYCDSSRFDHGLAAALEANGVKLRPYEAVMGDLETMLLPADASVWLDPRICNYGIQQVLSKRSGDMKVELLTKMGPVQVMKAAKNATEVAGMRAAHLRDGVALVTFLAWLERQVSELGNEPTECEAADVLDSLRAEQEHFVSLSFPTISGAGANGAVIHYRPLPESCARVTRDTMYLVDSGGQYRDGTTDVTRTLHFGATTAWQRACYTRVLRGHIALHRATFPKGTTGVALDSMARAPLWEAGLDYKHGTGHGVGHFLNVHEGPHMISPRAAALETPLQPGFVTSNEPGYYEDGAFGIRIENLTVVEAAPFDTPVARDKPFYTLANLTIAPIQVRLVDPQLMSPAELKWLDDYNQHCYDMLSPHLQGSTLAWLAENTRPVREQLKAEAAVRQ